MQKRSVILFALALVLLAGGVALYLGLRRASPHETLHASIDRAHLTLVYGRPYSKSPETGEVRKIWGGLVPYGRVWRTGADEATAFSTDQALMFGETLIPARAYTLFSLPEENGGSKLIFSRQVGEWGTQYDPTQDFARVDLRRETLPTSTGEFTMALEQNPAGGGTLRFWWEGVQYSAAFTVKN